MCEQSLPSIRLPVVLLRGGGDLASGVALRLHRAGIRVVITELPQPLAVRRSVAFSEAVYQGQVTIEGVTGCLVKSPLGLMETLNTGAIPVYVDPQGQVRFDPGLEVVALVDGRMTKRPPDLGMDAAPMVIGLGPGFIAGTNCHAAIETHRGHYLGRVIWDGAPQADTGIPGRVGDYQHERVLRAPADGALRVKAAIGDLVVKGARLARVGDNAITAPFDGVLRGLLPDGITVRAGMKVGDLDPRGDPCVTRTVSEKSLAIGGGVLEALLTRPEIRERLWS